jgi:hypothetical protein
VLTEVSSDNIGRVSELLQESNLKVLKESNLNRAMDTLVDRS